MSANHTTKKPNRKTPGPGEDGRCANRKRILTLAVILIAAAGILFAHKGDEIQNLIQSKGIHAEAGVAKAGYKSGGLSPKNLSDKSIRKTVPNYSGQPYRELNGGKPEFRKSALWPAWGGRSCRKTVSSEDPSARFIPRDGTACSTEASPAEACTTAAT